MKKSDEEIKREIIESATKLFIKFGYNKTTMEDIAKGAHKGKSTLYYYYKSKDDIILDVIEEQSLIIYENVKAQIAICKTAIERFTQYFNTTSEGVKKAVNVFYLLKSELKVNYDFFSKIKTAMNERSKKLLSEILYFGIETKEFTSIDRSSVLAIANLLDDINGLVISNRVIEEQNGEWVKELMLLSRLILNGIR